MCFSVTAHIVSHISHLSHITTQQHAEMISSISKTWKRPELFALYSFWLMSVHFTVLTICHVMDHPPYGLAVSLPLSVSFWFPLSLPQVTSRGGGMGAVEADPLLSSVACFFLVFYSLSESTPLEWVICTAGERDAGRWKMAPRSEQYGAGIVNPLPGHCHKETGPHTAG